MKAFGLTIDCLMKGTSASPAAFALGEMLSRSGPTLPVAPGIGLKVWHAPQPFLVKITAASVPPPPPSSGLCAVLTYHVLNAASFITIVVLRMVEWPSPQSSVQMTGNVPVL